jgi:hypothetical protein
MQNGGSTWAFAWSVPVARRPGCLAKDGAQTLRGVVGFRRFSRFPVPRQQRVQFVPLGAPRYDAFEYIGEPMAVDLPGNDRSLNARQKLLRFGQGQTEIRDITKTFWPADLYQIGAVNWRAYSPMSCVFRR